MAEEAYRLTFILLLAGSDSGTTQQTATIVAVSRDEAVELAQIYHASMPRGAIVSATLADATGTVLWSEQNGGGLDLEPAGRDRP